MILINTVEGDIEFDVTIREDTISSNTVTNNPVEFGADISDHNYVNPKRITGEIGVSNTPLRRLDTFSEFGTRAQNAWEVLQAIKDAGDIFDLQTGFELITGVALVDISAPRDSATSGVLMSKLTFQQVFLAEQEEGTLTAEQLADIVNNQAASNTERGQVEKAQVKDKSTLATIFDINVQ